MKGLPAETDFVVIGAGVAGLRAAIELAAAGRVLVLAKKETPNFKAADAKSEAAWLSDEEDIACTCRIRSTPAMASVISPQ